MERRVAFDEDSLAFAAQWEHESKTLVERIETARKLYPQVEIAREQLFTIADFCLEVGVDGHRGDIIMMKAAKTLAAFDQRNRVQTQDIETAAELTLPHRMRRQPLMDIGDTNEKIKAMRRNI
jgi:magnesium chelatase subunit I